MNIVVRHPRTYGTPFFPSPPLRPRVGRAREIVNARITMQTRGLRLAKGGLCFKTQLGDDVYCTGVLTVLLAR